VHLFVCLAVALTSGQKYPFLDPKLPWSDRVDDLVNRLTLDEIVNQSAAIYGQAPPTVDRLGINAYTFDTECLRGYTDRNATAFPQALGLAATFSREVLYNMTFAVSHELRAYYNNDLKQGIHGRSGLSCLSPVINIMRHPLWGRNQETYGEDPYLSGELVTQYVRGLQGDHPRYARATAGCKHFATYAGPEDVPVSRFGFNVQISERDLRMTFLPQFKACIQAGTYNVMCSFSRLNGVPACANKKLLTDILRNEWKFKGYVISDDDALLFAISQHHYFSNKMEAAAAAVKAGCNLELSDVSSDWAFASIPQAVSKGLLTKDDVSNNVKPIFYTRMRLGEFDPQDMNPYSNISMSVVLSPEHQELAIQAASMSFVLLKNLKGYLPFKKRFARLAIVGPMADNPGALFGGYTPAPDRKFIKTPLEGLRRLGDDVRYASGCDNTGCLKYSHDDIKQAVVGAGFVIVCLGLGTDLELEGRDRSDLELPGNQLQLLKDAIFYSREAPLLLLLFNADPLDVTFAEESPEVDAIIACFYPAQATGEALYRVLTMTGPHSVPAGRLPATWPAQLHQIPPITNYNVSDGQTYRYLSGDPLYPFGYGLSYSQFHYAGLAVSPTSIKAGQNVTVTVSVTNRGPYEADEVIQVYLSWVKAPVKAPQWTLVGFDRKTLSVDSPQQLTFTVTAEQMSLWLDDTTGFSVVPGDMIVYAGGQQPFQRVNVGSNVMQAKFTIT
jgi:beta-glucosidase